MRDGKRAPVRARWRQKISRQETVVRCVMDCEGVATFVVDREDGTKEAFVLRAMERSVVKKFLARADEIPMRPRRTY